MTGDPRPVGRPPKDGRLHQVRLTDDVHRAVLDRAERDRIPSLSDAVALAAQQWATQDRCIWRGVISFKRCIKSDGHGSSHLADDGTVWTTSRKPFSAAEVCQFLGVTLDQLTDLATAGVLEYDVQFRAPFQYEVPAVDLMRFAATLR